MKRILVVVAVLVGLTALTAFAQMGGGGGMGGQTMTQEMMRDMSGMMEQMNGMMQKLAHPMRHVTVTDHAKMNEMGKIMREMAVQMNEMALHLESGKVDKGTVGRLQEKMKAIDGKLDALQKDSK